MGPARIYPWRKVHRCRAPSIAPGTFFVAQPWADCITNMPGFNLRQAQRAFLAQNGAGAMLIVLMDVSACAQRYLQRLASLPRTTTSNRQRLSRSRADLRQTQRHTPKPMLQQWQGMFRPRQTFRRVQLLAQAGRL